MLGPPPTSGTRDTFNELAMLEGCRKVAEVAKAVPDEKARERACMTIREDGAYVEAGENDNLIVQKLTANPNAFGVFGYSYLDQNRDTLQAATMDGAGPWKTLWLVGLPMVRNGLVVIFIVNFVTAWGEYLLCTTLTNDQTARTMPVVLAAAQGGLGQWSWPALAAVYVIVVTPGIIAFAFAQKLFFKGLTEGMLKG